MAKQKARTPSKRTQSARTKMPAGRSAKGPGGAASARGATSARVKPRKSGGSTQVSAGKAPKKEAIKEAISVEGRQPQGQAARKRAAPRIARPPKKARLDRVRRTLDEIVPTPPSSLDMDRHASAARTGRAGIAESLREHRGMTDVTAGDVDVDVEDAFFAGEEAPGGDNPTPDQDIVDDIGRALGVQYEDNEELKGADKLIERDRKRWELDPASSEDYKDRK
jgi:hypothetical protein